MPRRDASRITKSEIQTCISELEAAKDVRFARLLAICEVAFGSGRVRGSHHVFSTPWPGDPRINLQPVKGGKAKRYQVRQVLAALVTLLESLPT
ncbi:MAG: toxin HicA [Planctomycetes bacterium]|nr:toxin HicA [Planctomycetota bacterium]